MIAAFGDLDVRGVAGRSQHPRGGLVVEVVGQIGDGAIPGFSGEAALGRTRVALRSRMQDPERRIRGWCWRKSRRRENAFQFSGAYDRIYFRNVLANLVAKAFDQTARH